MFAQEYTVTKVNGDVKYQSGGNEIWIDVKEGNIIKQDAVLTTGTNSSVTLRYNKFLFTLNGVSAISLSSIKEMSTDELLLALAMEDLINAPKNNGNEKSGNTAVYGTDESNNENPELIESKFGVKRLNGAMQLAEYDLKESAVVVARETFRKYPGTKQLPSYRIFFANILFEKGLYNEAYEELIEIAELNLTDEESQKVNERTEKIRKILLSN